MNRIRAISIKSPIGEHRINFVFECGCGKQFRDCCSNYADELKIKCPSCSAEKMVSMHQTIDSIYKGDLVDVGV